MFYEKSMRGFLKPIQFRKVVPSSRFYVCSVCVFLFFVGVRSYAQPKRYVLCRLGKIVRTIRIQVEDQPNGCKTIYTKAGVDRVVGYGKFYATCLQFAENVESNLEKAGWKCKIIKSVEIVVPKSDEKKENNEIEQKKEEKDPE